MKRLRPLLLLPLLWLPVACVMSPPAGSGPEAVCEREANNDPAVQDLTMRRLGNPAFSASGNEEIKYLHDRAKSACLRRMGALPQGHGGVEPVRRPQSAFQGLR